MFELLKMRIFFLISIHDIYVALTEESRQAMD